MKFGSKPGLERVSALLEENGCPQNELNIIHVAGTNGKGSVSAMIAKSLTLSGKKIGLFTSPYVSDFCERIQIDGEMISHQKLTELVEKYSKQIKKLGIEDWELCKVLSNLIDNAVKALEDFEGEEKKLRVNITETPERYIFSVEDNGPKIPESIRENIFKKGFSTRKEEGHGMGLAIVSEILNKSGGDIELSSDDEETVFTVSFGKGE